MESPVCKQPFGSWQDLGVQQPCQDLGPRCCYQRVIFKTPQPNLDDASNKHDHPLLCPTTTDSDSDKSDSSAPCGFNFRPPTPLFSVYWAKHKLLINEVDSYTVTPLQFVKLLALYIRIENIETQELKLSRVLLVSGGDTIDG
ncbi:hypothetical protein L1887_10926 [Cichorium endivia]|nr:hypothetical protein L1887_10926 [Cichorium endivia]